MQNSFTDSLWKKDGKVLGVLDVWKANWFFSEISLKYFLFISLSIVQWERSILCQRKLIEMQYFKTIIQEMFSFLRNG